MHTTNSNRDSDLGFMSVCDGCGLASFLSRIPVLQNYIKDVTAS